MGTGISISSINRIKELAEQKKYAEALEILDTQDLDKSINPQFLRISGEIFRENKRYYDSRRYLLKSHQMSPMGNRIIFEIIQLYLELGYYAKAEKYYEQYQFNSTEDDVQKDFVEYLMKKAKGTDPKELASILIPILERMPEDKWNFEAVLLYDKMGRKDKALEESQYILEHYKESPYVQLAIDYINDKLDVDKHFNVFPEEEQPEDKELFGNLLEEEEKLLQADYLRMYPPEARIMVESEDKEAVVEAKPAREKKAKKKKKKSKEEDIEDAKSVDSEEEPDDNKAGESSEQKENPEEELKKQEELEAEKQEQIKQEREAALEKILSRKIDKDKIKESAKQVAQAVKDIDTSKAKNQVMSVAESVKDNVKKATDALGEVVGAKLLSEDIGDKEAEVVPEEEQIVDGIIESVLEPPKRAVGQVVMNEELDALVPDSLEAMSADEIADIEAKQEEAERLELEALEASLKLEEEKKAKKLGKNSSETEEEQDTGALAGSEIQAGKPFTLEDMGSFEEKKAEFLAKMDAEEEMAPLDSLGFITVVQSDVDSAMEEDIPDAAGILRQMIDNKEYYSGEDSTGFESKASYKNHGFEVEDYEFELYRNDTEEPAVKEQDEVIDFSDVLVRGIYAENGAIISFEDMVPEEISFDEPILSEKTIMSEEETLQEEPKLSEEPIVHEEPTVFEEPIVHEEPTVFEEPIVHEATTIPEEPVMVEESIPEEPKVISEETVIEKPAIEEFIFEKPEVFEEPELSEEPIVHEEPTVFEEPIMHEEPTVFEEPIVHEETAVLEEPVMVEESISEEPIIVSEETIFEVPEAEEPKAISEETIFEVPEAEEPKAISEETVFEVPEAEEPMVISEETVFEKPVIEEMVFEKPEVFEEAVPEEPSIFEEPTLSEKLVMFGESIPEDIIAFTEDTLFKKSIQEQLTPEEISDGENSLIYGSDLEKEESDFDRDRRENIRIRILLSDSMIQKLSELKESR